MTSKAKINLNDLQTLSYDISSLIGYLTDNSCGDIDCCGGPYYTEEDFKAGTEALAKIGLEYDPDSKDIVS